MELDTNLNYRKKMETTQTNDILKELFRISIPGEGLDGGQFIEDTKLYKLIFESVKQFKPSGENIDSLSFDFAVKAAAIEFNLGQNHGSYNGMSYSHYFDNKLSGIENYVLLLCNSGILGGNWRKEDIQIDYTKSFVVHVKTSERLSFDTIEFLMKRVLENELEIQITAIKTALQSPNIKQRLIQLLAGSTKTEYIESANQLFDDIIKEI